MDAQLPLTCFRVDSAGGFIPFVDDKGVAILRQWLRAISDISASHKVINRRGNIKKEFLGSSPSKQKLLRETVDRLLKESAK